MQVMGTFPDGHQQPTLISNLAPRSEHCSVHGPYLATGVRVRQREIWKPCPSCTSEQEEEERVQQERARVQAMQVRAGIPVRYVGSGFDSFRAETPAQEKVLRAARAYAEGFAQHLRTGRSLMLLGKVGTGKTHLMCAVLQALMPVHCGLYLTVSELIGTIRETWRRDSERSQAKALNELANVPLLVIDELGAQYGTDGEQNTLFTIVDRRYNDRKPMLVASNLNRPNLKAIIGDRSYDRLDEVASVEILDWESYRTKTRRGVAA
jgi:DNA replication protein DnaC